MLEFHVMDPLFATLGGTVIAGVVWAVRQEGRLNAHDALFEEREKQTNERHTEMAESLKRIELKLDRVVERRV
jgi:hypothetical protein